MRIGKVSFPPYFNTDYLVFKPHLFLKEHFTFKFVFWKLPLLFLFLKFCGGAFNFVSNYETKQEFRWFTDILRWNTPLDNYLSLMTYDFISLLGISGSSGMALVISWIAIGLIFFFKIMVIYYILAKFLFIFLYKTDDFNKMTFEELVDYKYKRPKNKRTKEEISKVLKEIMEFSSFLKRC